MKKCKLIVVEGACDGIGKTTQYKMLCDHFKDDGISVVNHHFPSYGTSEGALVERYLKGEFGEVSKLSPYFVNSLYAQDRAITWITGLKEEYDRGNIIVLDRYTTSSLIYQSSVIEDENERKKFINYVSDYEYHKLGLPEPDMVIFLHAPFEIAQMLKNKRLNNDGVKNDIHEKDYYFMKKVSDISIDIAKMFNWDFIECSEGNKMRSQEEIHEDVYKLVKKKIG